MANTTDNTEAFEARVSELQQENQLLLVELHQAQEELERNYSGAQTGGAKSDVVHPLVNATGWVPDDLPEMHAENRRLQALIDVQKRIHKLESSHALNVRLGNILIEGVDAPSSLLSVPGKLVKIWRQSTRQNPPAALGGKDFSKVIAAWQSGGFDAVENVMGGLSVAPAMQAHAYTTLARYLGKGDRENAAVAARRAYGLDPKLFRLKWLAFRLHEAGDVVEAEAMLDLLPEETQFSESEARQARQLRNDAKRVRENEAKQKTAFWERRAAADKVLSNLVRERDQQVRLATDRVREIESLKQAKVKLQTEKSALVTQLDLNELKLRDALDASMQKSRDSDFLLANLHRVQEELEQAFAERESLQLANVALETQARDAEERCEREIEALKDAIICLEQEKQALAAKREAEIRIAEERNRELEALRRAKALLEQEKYALATRQDAQVKVIEERVRQIELLKQANSKLELEKQALGVKHEVELRIAEERNRELEVLRQTKTLLEQEKQSLTVKHEVQSGVVAERVKELEALKQARARLEEEKFALATGQDAQAKVAEEHGRQMELLKQAKAKLEQEKHALTEGRDAQARVAEERGRELLTLKQTKAKLEQEKTELERLKRAAVHKTNKGDADIDDLVLDLELFFNGKAIIYVDVGAYVGDVFLKIKRSSKKFRIHEAHLFEPNPNSYALLTNKIAGADSPVVHAYNLAIGESTDTHRFIAAKSMTKALSVDLQAENGPGDVFTARCVSLDSQASIFTDGKINLLKIDVEGKEMDVLSSARKLFASQSVDVIYIEVGFNRSGTQQTYFSDVDQFLQRFGYRVLRIYEQKEEWMQDSPLLRRANIAYMSEQFANAHPLKLMHELQELKNRINELSSGMLKLES